MTAQFLCGHWTFFRLSDEWHTARCDLEAGHEGELHKYWWSPETHESFEWNQRFERHDVPREPAEETCDGSRYCKATEHIHGCFASPREPAEETETPARSGHGDEPGHGDGAGGDRHAVASSGEGEQ